MASAKCSLNPNPRPPPYTQLEQEVVLRQGQRGGRLAGERLPISGNRIGLGIHTDVGRGVVPLHVLLADVATIGDSSEHLGQTQGGCSALVVAGLR